MPVKGNAKCPKCHQQRAKSNLKRHIIRCKGIEQEGAHKKDDTSSSSSSSSSDDSSSSSDDSSSSSDDSSSSSSSDDDLPAERGRKRAAQRLLKDIRAEMGFKRMLLVTEPSPDDPTERREWLPPVTFSCQKRCDSADPNRCRWTVKATVPRILYPRHFRSCQRMREGLPMP